MREKEFARNVISSMIETKILELLREKPYHGYGIINYFRKNFHVYLGASTIYPALNRLREERLATYEIKEMESGRVRKIHKITNKGLKELQMRESVIALTLQPIQQIEQKSLIIPK